MAVAVEFVGHACFRIWENGMPLVVTDPYTHSDVGLVDDGHRLEAEYVIVSSLTDLSHNNVQLVRGNPTVINALDLATGQAQAQIQGEPVVAIPAAENPDHPDGPDDNGLYAFKVGDLWFGHLGDLGFGLSQQALEPWLGRCDVLLAIVGEKYSLSLDELDAMIAILKPRWIFPMHYRLPPPGQPMVPVSNFLRRRVEDPIVHVKHHTVSLPLPTLKADHPTIIVLDPSGYSPLVE